MNNSISNKKHTTKLTSKSIESSGLPSDYKKVIAEYIWNGFDANASEINIDFDANQIGYINTFSISDNGTGINIEELDDTFGNFNDSKKANSFSQTGFVKGKKGKGRYSFTAFCNSAIWDTIFKTEKGDFLNYKIGIKKEDSQNYETFDTVISKNSNIGTKVIFENFHSLTGDLLEDDEFVNFLSCEFGWFLYLNKEKEYKININNKAIDYFAVIVNNEDREVKIGDNNFIVSFIQWKEKIGDKYFYYFLNNEKIEVSRRHTSFNNKAIDFHHSIYVQSEYFDKFRLTKKDEPVLDFVEKNQTDEIYKALISILNNEVAEKEKLFIKNEKAEELIIKYNNAKVLPLFKFNPYEQLRKKDLENVIKDLYCIQPKIFQNLTTPQSKTIVGFLNLLLDTEQRENILEIVENVVKLTEEERDDLVKTLRKTKLSHISTLIKFLENRFNVVEILKTLIFKLEDFTNEREHIQKVIEENYWLFGEEYHLVSADQNFEILLNNYLYHLESNNQKPSIEKIETKGKLKRPDILISRKIDVPDFESNEYTIEENIIVELKRPNVIIGKKQFSQIEDYLGFIVNEDRFNSQLRKWKFILVGKKVDSYIEGLYENQKHKGKKFLVQSIGRYEIYAMSWDDIFKVFDNKHKHLINRLDFKSSVIEELEAKGISLTKDASDELTGRAVNE